MRLTILGLILLIVWLFGLGVLLGVVPLWT